MDTSTLVRMTSDLRDYCALFHPLFHRPEPRITFEGVLIGLMTATDRKNGWTLTRSTDRLVPDSVQRFFSTTKWDADSMLALLQNRILTSHGPRGALIFDDTGFPKKGRDSVGVQRMYTGTVGQIANCQLGIFAAWVTPHAHVLFERRLYLPKSWTDDKARCLKADVPDSVGYRTKPELAIEMLESAVARGLRPAWVGADKIYGEVEAFREVIAAHGLDYAVSISKQAKVWLSRPRLESPEEFNAKLPTQRGRRKTSHVAPGEPERVRVDEFAQSLACDQWEEMSCGDGAQGQRIYQWALTPVVEVQGLLPGRESLLIIRQKKGDVSSRAYFLAHSQQAHSAQTWVERIGTRWPIEQCFEEAKSECGMDEYEVRTWQGWHRHITLAMVAHNFLAEQRHAQAREEAAKKHRSPGRARQTPG